ncbi:MAG: hypothetical protein RLZZ223_407 [Candidatus Parcubacteria bacterium]|jgi:hypothetical protein
MAKDNLLETLSGRSTRNKEPVVCPTENIPLPDTLPTRCGTKVVHPNLKTLEQGRPDEG